MACDAPLSIRYNPPLDDGKGGRIYCFPADCGKCIKCLTKRKAAWSFRIAEEARKGFSATFVTLTYEDKYLTMGDHGPTINKQDHFTFIKKLKELEKSKVLELRPYISQEELHRKSYGIKEEGKLAYYGISEYGDRLGRPHWHYILINVRDYNNIALAWPYGLIHIDECNMNTIDYVLKYMIKENKNNESKAKEVSFMSKGIGLSAMDSEFEKFIQAPDANHIINGRGAKIALPRYYRKKFCSSDVRAAKGAYIAEAIQQKEAKQDTTYSELKLNPDEVRLQGKENRLNLLKNRSKRTMQ
ncbi:MAG: replication initiator protein [Microvirus sp.]|nr:MAG: replication initiator protein [Microvirus sp.]